MHYRGSNYANLRLAIDSILDQILKKLRLQKAAQDQFFDVRDGRYVVPVKIGAQHELPGTVHETSVSHQTAYIEPKEIENLNHKLKHKKGELLQEIYTILMETSKKLQPQSEIFLNSFNISPLGPGTSQSKISKNLFW